MSAVLTPPPPAALAAPSAPPALLTAEEFFEIYAGEHCELVRGHAQEVPVPSARHGEVAVRAIRYLDRFVDDNKLGRICGNDSLVVLRRSPDTVRGPDVCYFSYTRMPPGPAPEGVCKIVPELAVEVRSPSNTWSDIFGKVGEYLKAGVLVVLVLDSETGTASTYRQSGQQVFAKTDTLTLPDVLPGFAVPVASFFE